MNCKPGDLAVIVKSRAGNEGRILQCVRLASSAECEAELVGWWLNYGAVWVTDADLRMTDGGTTRLFRDDRLRPLRDSDGEDEMLRIAGKPQEVNA